MTRPNRRTIAVVASFAFGAGLAGLACVIADPPAALPVAPLAPPEILDDLATPPPPLLGSWPLEFVIPMQVLDPNTPVQWQAFLDYDPVLFPRPGPLQSGDDRPNSADDGGLRILTRRFAQPADMNACHTLEVVVALTFVKDHVPDGVGGDSVKWIYTPTGNLADCPVYDAGPYDAAVNALDASADGSDGEDGADP